MPKIPISFKNKSRDMKLYTTVKAQEEQSEFVKNAIAHYIEYLRIEERDQKQKD